ncbi:DUF6543 domain-containing protein [Pseudomonas sp. NA13]
MTGLANNLAQVELNESPRWYSALPLESRRNISGLNQEVLVQRQVFDEQLADYEVFIDFAKRTFAHSITPYLHSKGCLKRSIRPRSSLTTARGWPPRKNGQPAGPCHLRIRAQRGYRRPRKRRAFFCRAGLEAGSQRRTGVIHSRGLPGERYARHIRASFLDAKATEYPRRREAYRYMLLARMDRDLRVAHGKSILNTDEFQWLTRQVTLLSDGNSANGATHPGAAVTREGVIKLTVGGHVVQGVYVFTYFDPKAFYWLYTPDAPDGVLFRKYLDFSGSVAAQLHGYVLERVALTARAAVGRSLVALAAGNTRVDTLRELNRVMDISAEFDACIERAVTDVEDITTSRAEMIRDQVFKGLIFAALPVCMVYPHLPCCWISAWWLSAPGRRSRRMRRATRKGRSVTGWPRPGGAVRHTRRRKHGHAAGARGQEPEACRETSVVVRSTLETRDIGRRQGGRTGDPAHTPEAAAGGQQSTGIPGAGDRGGIFGHLSQPAQRSATAKRSLHTEQGPVLPGDGGSLLRRVVPGGCQASRCVVQDAHTEDGEWKMDP